MTSKIGKIFLGALFLLSLALPAFGYTVEGAKGERFTMRGYVDLDIGYRNTSKEYNTAVSTSYGTGVDRTVFFVMLPSSALIGNFTVGDVSADWAIATSSTTLQSNMQAVGTSNQKDNDIIDIFYATYKFGNSHIIAGKIGSNWTTFLPQTTFGYNPGTGTHVNCIAFGGIYDNKLPAIRFGQTINKMFSYHIALITTGTYVADTATTTYPPFSAPKNSNLSYSKFPTIAAKFTLNFGPVLILPGLAYQQVQWDGLPAGWDTTMTSWAVTLPGKVVIGPFVGLFNIAYGKNIGGPTGSVSFTSDGYYTGFQRNNVTGKIYDTTNIQGFIDLSMTFGPVTPHIFYGITHSTNDLWVVGNKYHERTSMGINAYIQVSKNFQVIPEFARYTYGATPGWVSPTGAKWDFGSDWLAGVKLRLTF
jgi:hypothetical protein